MATAGILSFSACESDEENRHEDHRGGRTTTTTTEETTTRRPIESTTETRTIRAY